MATSVIAAQLYTLREFTKTPADIAATLKKVRGIGYEAVQVSAIGPIEPAELARILTGEGLTCCSTHTAWGRLASEFDQVVEEHRLWGCVHPAIGGMPKEARSGEGVVKFAAAATEVGRRLAQAGMDFSYHNHNWEFARTGGKNWLTLFAEAADPAYVKMEIDTYWVQAGGADPADWIRRSAGRCPVIHLKDMVIAGGETRMAEIGEGNLNWPGILAAAREAGVEWYCVEQDRCYERNPFDSLKISLENLKGMGLE